MSFQRRLVPFLTVLASFAACGPMKVEPELALTASPRQLDGVSQKSTVKVNAVDDMAKPGTGKVRLTSTAGSMKDGVDVDLLAGEGVTEFTCVRATEPACTGSIRISAEWVVSGKLVSATVSISIASPVDAGVDAGVVVDAGVPDAGVVVDAGVPDAGVPDAGVDPGDAGITLTSVKPALISGTGDSTVLTATVTLGGAPVPMVPVTFTTNRGSFTPTSGTLTTMATTNTSGVATATLHASTASFGTANVIATAQGATASTNVQVVNVANLAYVPSTNTASYLVVRNAGSAAIGTTMTTLFWKVTDSNGAGVPDVLVTFAVNAGGAAGSTITPQAVSDAQGNLSATLSSGDSPGSITVKATVAATAATASEISVTHPGTNVIYGVPSDGAFTFTCSRKNLGALHVAGVPPPTRMGVNTGCSLLIQDRAGNRIPGGVPVQFLQEAGSISPNPTTIMGGAGVVTYDAFSNILPLDVTPVPGEPVGAVGRNPRDMLVTLVAIIAGEEEFRDSSGNGVWDPGEWFVDMGEPFLDSNDNGVWDNTEIYFDTVPRNSRYDGPNGTWDNNIQIFRTTHVLWTGGAQNLSWGIAPPFNVSGAFLTVPFYWGDAYLNPISPDSAGFSVALAGTTKGGVTGNAASFGLDGFGMPLATEPPLQVTESAPGSGIFTFGAACPMTGMVPNNLTRCMRRTQFAPTGWSGGGTPASITLTNASGPATTGVVTVTPQHGYSGSSPVSAAVTFSLQP